jgi:hypothetical protein
LDAIPWPVMDTDSILLSFSVGKQYLKARVSYIFENERAAPDRWGISTWSRKVARSSIIKDGNAADKANLPEATRHNQPRQQRNPRSMPLADLRRTRRRVERAIEADAELVDAIVDGVDAIVDGEPEEPAATNGGNDGQELPNVAGDGLLPLVNLTATAIARGEEIERGVNEAIAEELREHRRVTNVGRPDGHGGVLFVGPRF